MDNSLFPACPIANPQRAARLFLGFSPSIEKDAFESFRRRNEEALCRMSL
jgi:hypothetical protein